MMSLANNGCFKLTRKISFWLILISASLCAYPHPLSVAEYEYKPNTTNKDGTELAMIYIGASGCGFCRAPELIKAVIKAKDLLAQRAQARGLWFSTTGVAHDLDIEKGVAFLKDVGPFDQIVIGRGVYNLAVLEFVAKDAGALPGGVPQIIVYEQELRRTSTRVWAGNPRLILRVMGAEIVEWVSRGALLDEQEK